MMLRRLLLATLLLGALHGAPATAAPPPIKHVFVVLLENEDAATSFGASSPAPYLAKTLPSQGLLIANYYGIGHQSLDNYLALLSGQAPNPQTQADCQVFTDFLPGTMGADGQALGSGCVYPAAVKTLADQLTAKGLTWKGYMEDMGNDPARDGATTCAHPPLNGRDPTQSASATDQYAARHNPFVYFHSIIDDTASCQANVVPLARLDDDLASASSTPSFSFITPDLCHDGHDAKCADGGPGGLPAVDAFLSGLVPKITGSPAWKDSLLIVTFDEAESDSSACCGESAGPNTPSPGGAQPGPGGGRIGAVALSPYIAPGGTTSTPYNHYSLLRSLEDLYGLDHLGLAARPGLAPFGDDVYTQPDGPPTAATPACTTTTLQGRPRTLPRGSIVTGVRVTISGGHRVVRFRAAHGGRILIRTPGRVRHITVRACRHYTATVARHGTLTLTAISGRHTERRRL